MISFNFPFQYQESTYIANCHVIPPPPDRQYHIMVDDEQLRFQYGDVQMFIVRGDQITWGIPPQPGGNEFMRSLASALMDALKDHPEANTPA
jgi:hypothetical protein